jgi:eukaryotic-like serine/threonine-protein kinase
MSIGVRDLPWDTVEPYLDRALELEPQQQAAWLSELAGTHPDIAQSLRGLLARRDALNAAGFLSDSLFTDREGLQLAMQALFADQPQAEAGETARGAVVGPYRLLREIDRGGMSQVWLAERSDGLLKREIALKLPFVHWPMQVERFLRERDILAALTHPQIARLYDAGIGESGQPYLAMEYVEGTALLRHCDERSLTIRDRLHVFLQVLEAVEHAHAGLIIHRDLKPSNILVTPQGRVVLLDFGIGKLLTDSTAPAASLTQLSGHPLTPEYASPEQITGQLLGVGSDIYSLGVILYELMTGCRPYRPIRDSRAALEEAILDDAPRPPSQCETSAAAAAARSLSARRLTRTLRGDLDTILLEALQKKPQDRYLSVTSFARDITNYLARLPISARPDRYGYRLERFVSRHRFQVIAAGAALLALLAGATLALWQAQAAALERDRAILFASRNQAVTQFLGTIIEEAAESPTPVTVSEMIARSEKLALQDTSDVPENRAAILDLISQQYFAAGDSKHSAELTQRALRLLEHSPDHALHARLVCGNALARSELGHSSEAIAAIQRELATLNSDPETASSCLSNLAEICWVSRTPAEALRYAREAMDRYRQTSRVTGVVSEESLLEALAYSYHLNGRNADANRYFQSALLKYQQTGREQRPPAITMMGTWAVVIDNAGMPERALQLYDKLTLIAEQHGPGAQPARTIVANRARTLAVVGRFAQAREVYEQACRLAEEQDDTMGRLQCALGLASVDVQTNMLTEAATQLRRADELLDKDLSASSPAMIFRKVLEGRLDLAAGRLQEAHEIFARALATNVISPTIFFAQLGQSEIELRLAHNAAAIREAQSSLRIANVMQGGLPYSNQTGLAFLALGRAWQQQGDRDQARNALQSAVTHLSNTVDANHPELLRARQLLDSL